MQEATSPIPRRSAYLVGQPKIRKRLIYRHIVPNSIIITAIIMRIPCAPAYTVSPFQWSYLGLCRRVFELQAVLRYFHIS